MSKSFSRVEGEPGILLKHPSHDPKTWETDEASVHNFVNRAKHPHIMPLLSIRDRQLVLPYCKGPDLWDAVNDLAPGRPSFHTALRVCRQVAAAVAALHKLRVAHCDIKLENVCLKGPLDDKAHALLCDFGHARFCGDDRRVPWRRAVCLGTRIVNPPECFVCMVSRRGSVDAFAWDVWQLGVMIGNTFLNCHIIQPNTMKTFARRLRSRTPHAISVVEKCIFRCTSTLPPGVRTVVRRCCSINPMERPTAREVHELLMRVDGGEDSKEGDSAREAPPAFARSQPPLCEPAPATAGCRPAPASAPAAGAGSAGARPVPSSAWS